MAPDKYGSPINVRRYDITHHGVPMKPGGKLPNGAIILRQDILRTFDHRIDALVLAVVEGKGSQPFVSWVRMITTDSPLATGGFQIMDTCSWGHYCSTGLETAVERYEARLKERKEALKGYVGDLNG